MEGLKEAGKVVSDPFWARDVRAIIRDLEEEIRHEERQRQAWLPLSTVAAVLALDDALRAARVEVSDVKFCHLADIAIAASLGGERDG